ncbi:MAG: arylamine N-acetyltransferase [Chloracidobacterium sp.]|nr:arylamine N-acetyltransferase [Chloracidobacterium sp.]
MNTTAYLARIGLLPDHLEPNEEVLRLLQRKHLLSVPFENLDIHWKRPIVLNVNRFYEKIVANRRGGFCYELNGLFNELLRSIGYQTRLLSARVFNGTGYGPEFDHALIVVTIGDDEYLTDVGFGDFTAEPLRFSLGVEQHDPAGIFVVRRFDDEYFEVAKRDGNSWKSQYIFKDIARELVDFTEMCDFQQYSPDSHFKKGKVCSILTDNGRKTLTDKKFIVSTAVGDKKESDAGDEKFDFLLITEFGIDARKFVDKSLREAEVP